MGRWLPTPLEIPCILSTTSTAGGGGPADPSLEVTTVYSLLYFFPNPFLWLKHTCWEFPGGPWWGLTFTAGGLGSIPGQGTKIPQAAQYGLKKKKRRRKKKKNRQKEKRVYNWKTGAFFLKGARIMFSYNWDRANKLFCNLFLLNLCLAT